MSASLLAQQRTRQTGQQYEGNKNKFGTFLNDKGELPRLSILDNYKQIMRIMNHTKKVGDEQAIKFKNRLEKDMLQDEEYLRFKEEQNNTLKMGTILKSLQAPFKRGKNMTKSVAMPVRGMPSVGKSATNTIGADGQSKSSASMRNKALGAAGAMNVHGVNNQESNKDLN